MDEVTVTDADREAAAMWLRFSGMSIEEASYVANRGHDPHSLVAALARHREQSIAPYREALEKVREGLRYIRDGRYRISTICRAEVELARIDTTLQQGAK